MGPSGPPGAKKGQKGGSRGLPGDPLLEHFHFFLVLGVVSEHLLMKFRTDLFGVVFSERREPIFEHPDKSKQQF